MKRCDSVINYIERIDDIVCEQEFNVENSMFQLYDKYLKFDSYQTDPMIFQESDTPKRKTTIEKIIWFIPDMIVKLFKFIKSKIQKVANKSSKTISDNASHIINDVKKNKQNSKFIAAMVGIGATATATTTGVIIYNKHKKKDIDI